jgi:hypothetical protein
MGLAEAEDIFLCLKAEVEVMMQPLSVQTQPAAGPEGASQAP